MAARTRNAGRYTFLSEQAIMFLKRRCLEFAGGLLFIVGGALTLTVCGYDSTDPSWNHAVAREASNPLGPPGAWLADILIQGIGACAILPGFILMVWGWRIGRHRKLGRRWVRITAFSAMLSLTMITLAAFDPPAAWPTQIGLGGVLGMVLLDSIKILMNTLNIPLWPVTAIIGLMAIVAMGVTLGISRREWAEGIRNIILASDSAARAGWAGGRWSSRFAQNVSKASWRLIGRFWTRESDSNKNTVAKSAIDFSGEDPQSARCEPILTRRTKEHISPSGIKPPKRQIVAARRKKPSVGKRAAEADQKSLDLGTSEYNLPPLDALDQPPDDNRHGKQDEGALAENARLLESVLEDFGVRGRIVKVRPGPVVTLYELEPAPGTKSSRVISLADDIARSMSTISVRVAVVSGKNVIGIELPNAQRELVALRELVESKDYERHTGSLTLVLGKDIGGAPSMVDLARMPHLLIAGTTGSGKSVAVNTMIMSLLYRLTPDQCKFIMIDPKMLELSVYDDIPHLLSPVVTDPAKAVVALRWAVKEMEDRYRSMSNLGVRNINGYNQRVADALKKGEVLTRTVQTGFDPQTGEPIYENQAYDMNPLPYIVVIVDEMADLMLVAGKEVEAAVQRLAQMARAAGIHLIMATQRPSVDVITGTIKANFPTRISFQVTSKIDSRTILGEGGAEQLLGQGDMLYMAGGGRIGRVHGPFVSDEAVERVVNYLRDQAEPEYIEEVTEGEHENPFIPSDDSGVRNNSGDDEMYDRAVAVVCRERKASTSFVQRHLQIGYNRAARIIERMEAEAVISKANHAGKREVLARDIEDQGS